jgi:hypothetical protein
MHFEGPLEVCSNDVKVAYVRMQLCAIFCLGRPWTIECIIFKLIFWRLARLKTFIVEIISATIRTKWSDNAGSIFAEDVLNSPTKWNGFDVIACGGKINVHYCLALNTIQCNRYAHSHSKTWMNHSQLASMQFARLTEFWYTHTATYNKDDDNTNTLALKKPTYFLVHMGMYIEMSLLI